MPVITEGNNLGDLLKFEESHHYSRDVVTVADGQTLELGEVFGINSTDSKVYAIDPVAADGTEIAAGIMIKASAPSGSDEESLAIVRHATVSDNALVWPSGITVNQKATATEQLKALGILIRKGA